MAIEEIKILDLGDDADKAPFVEPPMGWEKLPADLNGDSGGDYIYLAYRKGDVTPIRAIYVMSRDKDRGEYPVAPPDGYKFAEVADGSVAKFGDLNGGAGGAYIYLCYSSNADLGAPIQEINVLAGGVEHPEPPPGWEMLRQDLNEGAGGDYIYLVYRR